MEDPNFKEKLPSKPTIIYKRPKTIRNIIAPSKIKPSNDIKIKKSWLGDLKGNYRCGSSKCGTCRFLDHKRKEIETDDDAVSNSSSPVQLNLLFMLWYAPVTRST